jgi:hypothetical protein
MPPIFITQNKVMKTKYDIVCTIALCLFSVFRLQAQFKPINEANLENLFVSTNGNDINSGLSKNAAFRTLKKALNVALAKKKANVGVKISLEAGTYRTEGTPSDLAAIFFNMNANEATSAPLIIEGADWNSANPKNTGNVIISGSEDWSGEWINNGDGTWSKPWPYAFPLQARTTFDGIPTNYGMADAMLRREMVHVNGQTYYQVNPPNHINQNSINERIGPSYFNFPESDFQGSRLKTNEGSFWVKDAQLESNGSIKVMGTITIKPPLGFNINNTGNLVEVTTRRGLLMFLINNNLQSSVPTNIILRNLVFQHIGGPWAIYFAGQDNTLIEDCKFISNRRAGFVIGSGTNITLNRVDASGNGVLGGAVFNVTNGLVTGSSFNNNARQAEILGYVDWTTCAIKMLFCNNLIISKSEARNNAAPGFWWDTGDVNCKIIESVVSGNSEVGLYMEANSSNGNNYEGLGSGTIGKNGIPNLGTNPTVLVQRCIIADNQAPVGTEKFHSQLTGQGVWIKENENTVIEGSIIYNNSIQVSCNDARRAEIRNSVLRNNLIGAQVNNQRLYAYSNRTSSAQSITINNDLGNNVATIKGSWFALFDSFNSETNDNLYYFPQTLAFPSRVQRDGTNANISPALSIEGWRTAHLTNTNNNSTNKNVDSRSRLFSDPFSATKPLVYIVEDTTTLSEKASLTKAFTIYRVSMTGYDKPLTINYKVRTSQGDAINGIDFQMLSGTVTIPQGERSVGISIDPQEDNVADNNEKVVLELDANSPDFVVSKTSASIEITDNTIITSIENPNNLSNIEVIVFPNPSINNDLNVVIKGLVHKSNYEILIYDAVGITLITKKINVADDDLRVLIPIEQIKAQNCILIIKNENGIICSKKVIIN